MWYYRRRNYLIPDYAHIQSTALIRNDLMFEKLRTEGRN